MKESRLQELNFLVRTKTPLSLTETRAADLFSNELYDDFYTIKELVEAGYLDYVGRDQHYQIFLRPMQDFKVLVGNEVYLLKSGEMVALSVTKAGHAEFQDWIDSHSDPLL